MKNVIMLHFAAQSNGDYISGIEKVSAVYAKSYYPLKKYVESDFPLLFVVQV